MNVSFFHVFPRRVAVALVALLFIAPFAQADEAPVVPKNIIFLIGDGMGLTQVSGAMAISDEPLALARAQIIGLMNTTAANAYVTDSAAAGTALAAGIKTDNGVIGQTPVGDEVPSLFDYAVEAGKSTGVVVTSAITHATPAAFTGHNKTRKDEEDLAADYLDSRPEVAIGGGRQFFEQREDGKFLPDTFAAQGYTIAYTLDEVLEAPTSAPLLGLLADKAMPRMTEGRGDMLPLSTEKALEILGNNPQGFVLMVEGSQIDWGGHANDWEYVSTELFDFDQVVKIAFDYADAHPGTLVIVTADHETGGMSLVGGDLKDKSVKAAWGTGGHSATMVPVYAYGPGAEAFAGIYDNTNVFKRLMKLMGWETRGVSSD